MHAQFVEMAKTDIKAPYDNVRTLWKSESTLDRAMAALDKKWAEAPCLTVHPMTTALVDAETFAKCSTALQEFHTTAQHRLIELIGRSACKGVWSSKMSEMCFRAGNALHAEFSSEETTVVTELYERITVHCTKHGRRSHTNEEVDNVLNCL